MNHKEMEILKEKGFKVGDRVGVHIRGGERRGTVQEIVLEVRDGKDGQLAVKHPPKLVWVDQHGHRVEHNPSACYFLHDSA